MAVIVNTSMKSGSFPTSQKCAIVTPILKKSSLDSCAGWYLWSCGPHVIVVRSHESCDLSNYRPVSNLSFISKILERSVYVQMNNYLQDNGITPREAVGLQEIPFNGNCTGGHVVGTCTRLQTVDTSLYSRCWIRALPLV